MGLACFALDSNLWSGQLAVGFDRVGSYEISGGINPIFRLVQEGRPSALVQLYGSSNGLRRDKALLDLPQGNEHEVPIH